MAFYQPTLFPEPEQDPPKPEQDPKGGRDKRGHHRYSEDQKQEMCRLYQAGQSLKQIATLFGCDLGNVWRLLKRRGVKIRSLAEGHALRNYRVKHTPESRRKMSEKAKARGESHNFRVDGKGDERRKERKSSMSQLEYRLWREAVFQRDNYTCQECGRHGGLLRADHIKPWRDYPELRFDVSNGRTLCDPCHKKTPTYGGRLLRKKQE